LADRRGWWSTPTSWSARYCQAPRCQRISSRWREGGFDLLTSAEQIDELMRVTRYPKIRTRLTPALAGRLVNDLRAVALLVTNLPAVAVCPDPHDDYLLATAQAGAADYLVTGDKATWWRSGFTKGPVSSPSATFFPLAKQLP
jgi:putative PIN family toxin of toxin-antitoxin system